jgi:hypothetical protein
MQFHDDLMSSQIIIYRISELNKFILKQPSFSPVTFYENVPIHAYDGPEIPSEVFRKGMVIYGKGEHRTDFEIWASNFGRIRSLKETIIPQKSIGGIKDEDDYLMAYIDDVQANVPVHRIVASIWLSHIPDTSDLHVHHITNNGFDNRPCNLLWVTPGEHGKIHNPST